MAWAPDYLTVEQLAEYVNITDSDDDALLAPAIAAASRAIDRATNRQFGLVAAPVARYYTARWDQRRCRWVIEIDDLQTTVGLLIMADRDDDGSYSDLIDEYALRPVNAQQDGKPWTQVIVHPTSTAQPTCLEAGVEAVAKWGWTAFPDVVVQACYLQASRFYERRKAPFGVAGSPDAGSEMRLLAKVDPDVAVMLGPVTRQWGAA